MKGNKKEVQFNITLDVANPEKLTEDVIKDIRYRILRATSDALVLNNIKSSIKIEKL